MTDSTSQFQDLNNFIEITKQSILAEQERAKLENERLEEEKLRRLAEEGRVKVLQSLVDKIDILMRIVKDIKPLVDIMARNGDLIAEILRILANNIPHMAEKDLETITKHITTVMASQQSRFGSIPNHGPINVNVGPQFEATKDINVTTHGDQTIG